MEKQHVIRLVSRDPATPSLYFKSYRDSNNPNEIGMWTKVREDATEYSTADIENGTHPFTAILDGRYAEVTNRLRSMGLELVDA